jgi:putative transposase
MSSKRIQASREALFRYQVVSRVQARLLGGGGVSAAVLDTAGATHWDPDEGARTVKERTVWRWKAAWKRGELAGLEPAARTRESTDVLPKGLLDFMVEQKRVDVRASIPELLKRGVQKGLLESVDDVDRVTVWRALRRLGMATRRRKAARERDARRWSYPNRMQLMLCDGKHFRASATRVKRVALFFLDDASRFGLDVVVGTAESTWLFLTGVFAVVSEYGLMDVVYLDRGPGFRSDDTAEVIGRLPAHLVLGEAAYPEGHGKVEKFNQSALNSVLRNLNGRPDVDPDLGALQSRLRHFLHKVYNHTPHESLDNQTPAQRFHADERALRFPDSIATLRSRFVIHEERTVSNDNILSVEQVDYEVPRGHAQSRIAVQRHVLDQTVSVLHEGRVVQLHPVDLAANAIARRATPAAPSDETQHPLPPTAAEMMWRKEFAPVVGADGGVLPMTGEKDEET